MEGITALGGFLLAGVIYFLPSIAARGQHNVGAVVVVNLFLGWTLIGWVVALAMAMNRPAGTQQAAQPQFAPPGWYADPHDSPPGQMRYFDGVVWTEHVQPAPPQ